MGDAGAIGDASTTLVGILEDDIRMQDVNVVLSSPADLMNVTSQTIGVFLYQVTENPHESTLNDEAVSPTEVQQGPLVVDLHYLLTAYAPSGNTETQGTANQHKLLGDAMRVLRDRAVVRGSSLDGSLEGELRISPGDSTDTIMDIWNTFGETPYRPSVAYTVSAVSLGAPEPETAGRVETLARRGSDG